MVMKFAEAGAAQVPDFVRAASEQAQIAGALREGEKRRQASNLKAGAEFATQVPEGGWSQFGKALMGGGAPAATAGVLEGGVGGIGSLAGSAESLGLLSAMPEALGAAEAVSTLGVLEGGLGLGGMAAPTAALELGAAAPAAALGGPATWLAMGALGLGLFGD